MRELAENIREVFWLSDIVENRICFVSQAYELVWGRSCASLYADPDSWVDGVHPDDRKTVIAAIAELRTTGNMDQQFRVLRSDQTVRWVRSRGFPIRDEQGQLVRVAGLAEDVTEIREQQDRISRLNRVLAVHSGINAAIVRIRQRPALFAEACRVAVDNGHFALAWIGLVEPEQIVPMVWRSINVERAPPKTIQIINGMPSLVTGHSAGLRSRAIISLREEGAATCAMVLYAEESSFFDDAEIRLLNDLAGDLSCALDHIGREERLNYLALYDTLTGLPNRRLFIDRTAQLLLSARRGGAAAAVILLDIDHFKNINDRMGRAQGDALLKVVGERLTVALPESACLARVGSDVFAITFGALHPGDDALGPVCGGVFPTIEAAISTPSGELRLTARAGIALYPGDGDDAEILLSHAELALRQAKASGTTHAHFDSETHTRIGARLALERDLRRAVEQGEFVAYYQPKLSLHNGRIVGAEALIRWQHPERGLLAPGHFISLAEDTGLIVPIGEWILQRVCAQQAHWLNDHLEAVPVAVNLSMAQFRAHQIVESVRNALSTAAIAPRYLELELTESVVMDDPEGQVQTLIDLRQLGVSLSLDDFGTGYSSLAYLRRYPFCALKIDRAFVTEITGGPEEAIVADAVISLARRLGMKTIAEGVETTGQMLYLRDQGCDEMQGFLFSKPVPAADFEAMLRGGKHLAMPGSALAH